AACKVERGKRALNWIYNSEFPSWIGIPQSRLVKTTPSNQTGMAVGNFMKEGLAIFSQKKKEDKISDKTAWQISHVLHCLICTLFQGNMPYSLDCLIC
ncbi:hypothetical protein A2U01_0004620, partial [Trifolium medium]|nr:hypothetical protein [Trifolium medium]